MSRPRVALICQRSAKVPIVFDSARRQGFELFIVMAPNEQTSFQEYADVVCGTQVLDIFGDPAGSELAFIQLMEKQQLCGLVTTREEAIPWVATVSRGLGRPALSEAAALACRDKLIMRRALRAYGLNQPRSESLRLDEVEEMLKAEDLRFPLVLKPRFGMGSLGVVKVESMVELKHQYANSASASARVLGPAVGSQPYFSETLLVEEFIPGPELVADTFSVNGEVRMLSIAYKGDAPGPYFERSVYEAPYLLPASVEAEIRHQVLGGLVAVGLQDGPSHTEIRLRDGSTPYIIEIGARVGGSGVSAFIVNSSLGIDPFHLQVLQACGIPISLEDTTPKFQRYAGNFVIPMQGDGEFVTYHGLDAVKADPATCYAVTFFEPGFFAYPYPQFLGYPGFIMSQHTSNESLRKYHKSLFHNLRVEWRQPQ